MTRQTFPAQSDPFASLAALQGPLMQGAERGSALCARSLLAWQQEMMGFAARRLRENGEAGAALLRCRTPAEVVTVQHDWLRTALDSYAEEGDRLLAVAGEAAGDLTAEAEAVYRPLAQATAELPDGSEAVQPEPAPEEAETRTARKKETSA